MKKSRYIAPQLEVAPVETEYLLAASLTGSSQGDVGIENEESDDEGRVKGYTPFGENPFR